MKRNCRGLASAVLAAGVSVIGAIAHGGGYQVIHRLPIEVVPENVFEGFGNADFNDPSVADVNRIKLDYYVTNSTYNVITLTLRCEPDLNDPRTKAKVREYVAMAHARGMKVMMDIDPRIARHKFLAMHPEDCERVVHAVRVPRDKDGKAVASAERKDSLNDHMSWGSSKAYDATATSLLGGWAVKSDGTKRRVKTTVTESNANSLTASCEGLAEGEDFVALVEFRLYSIDVFSPLLMDYTRHLMEEYRELGIDGAMKDEWGHPPSYSEDALFRKNIAHWYSPNFAKAYAKATGGRVLAEDFVEMTFGGKGAEEMVDAYNRVNLERNVAIERHHYFSVKELFGDDTYVAKHPTWWGSLNWPEFRHNGLDWWQAKRDWAQTDETTAVPVMLSLSKKFGRGWLNEGYQNAPEKYAVKMWQYALCGGRMVFHGIWPMEDKRYESMSNRERALASKIDILKMNAAVAQSRIHLANILTESLPDSPVAFVFGHMNLMNWLKKSTYSDWGGDKVAALTSSGWLTDAYPSTELKNFTVDSEGWLRMGAQRYHALALYHPDPEDAAAFARITEGGLRTKVFELAKGDRVTAIKEHLERCGAGKQPAVCRNGAWNADQYPERDGVLRMIDGTLERFKGCDSTAGDSIEGVLALPTIGVGYRAVGFFGARERAGKVEALAGAQVSSVEFPGFRLSLKQPEDLVLKRDSVGWHGILQRKDVALPVPDELLAITRRWKILSKP